MLNFTIVKSLLYKHSYLHRLDGTTSDACYNVHAHMACSVRAPAD